MDEAETPTPRVEPERVDPQATTRDDFGRVQSHNREWPATESPTERKDHVLGQGFEDSLPDPGSPVVPPLRLSTPGSVGSYASPASMMSRSGMGQDSVVARLKAQLADYIRLEHMHGAADRPRLYTKGRPTCVLTTFVLLCIRLLRLVDGKVRVGALCLSKDETTISWQEEGSNLETIVLSNVLDIVVGSPSMEEPWRAKGGFNASCCFTIIHRLPAPPDEDEWAPMEPSQEASIHLQCPRVYDVLLWVCGMRQLLTDTSGHAQPSILRSVWKPHEVRQALEKLKGGAIEDPACYSVDQMCAPQALLTPGRPADGARATDKVIVLLKRCIGDYRAMRCLRLGGPVRLRKEGEGVAAIGGTLSQREDATGVVWRPSAPVSPDAADRQGGEARQEELKILIQAAMQAGDYERLAAYSLEMKSLQGGDSLHTMWQQEQPLPLVFPYARVVDFILGPPAGVEGGSLCFSLVLDMDPSSSMGSMLPSPMQQDSPAAAQGGRWQYTFELANRDDLFLWVRGFSMALEKTGRCASSFTVADIHAAIRSHSSSKSVTPVAITPTKGAQDGALNGALSLSPVTSTP